MKSLVHKDCISGCCFQTPVQCALTLQQSKCVHTHAQCQVPQANGVQVPNIDPRADHAIQAPQPNLTMDSGLTTLPQVKKVCTKAGADFTAI
jgi:hypothetical protein